MVDTRLIVRHYRWWLAYVIGRRWVVADATETRLGRRMQFRAEEVSVDAIDRLTAIEEIRILKSRYFDALDSKNWGAYAGVFTADAVIDMRDEALHHVGHPTGDAGTREDWLLVGGRAVADFLSGALVNVKTIHQGHQPQITVTGPETATGYWSFYDWLDFGYESFHGFGHYHEEYRRVDGSWLISLMRLSRMRVEWVSGNVSRPAGS